MRRLLVSLSLGAALFAAAAGVGRSGSPGGPRTYTVLVPPATGVDEPGVAELTVTFEKGVVTVVNAAGQEGQEVHPAWVTFAGDGDSDVDLRVHDARRILIADDGLTDRGHVAFLPAEAGAYRIRLLNRGAVWNAVRVTHN